MSPRKKTEDTLSLDQVPLSLRKDNVSLEGAVKSSDDDQLPDEDGLKEKETQTQEKIKTAKADKKKKKEKAEPKVVMTEGNVAESAPELPYNEILKNARLKAKLCRGDIIAGTRLPLKTIENLEDGALDQLPELVYTRAFVRTYAKYLELDADSVVANFHRVYEEKTGKKACDPAASNLIDEVAKDNLLPQKAHASGLKKGIYLLFVIAIALGIYFYL